ncbi:hypothetical protein BJ138DRAFT_1150132 [Hygrophoropsis aurantiaca]|uniref:Uncharacterized protein n=1 Tax=Hygrophoropsis aurantiaca TaxID=72124 RepID=A0ACB8AEW2_9AGAM|nr:hypothetical protein BJ138DRAFT_1150132 [Hygrophoropsis aurantiaca]
MIDTGQINVECQFMQAEHPLLILIFTLCLPLFFEFELKLKFKLPAENSSSRTLRHRRTRRTGLWVCANFGVYREGVLMLGCAFHIMVDDGGGKRLVSVLSSL